MSKFHDDDDIQSMFGMGERSVTQLDLENDFDMFPVNDECEKRCQTKAPYEMVNEIYVLMVALKTRIGCDELKIRIGQL